MGAAGLITWPDSGPIGNLQDLFANLATSVNDALPLKGFATLAAMNAVTYDEDTIALGTWGVLTADDSGLSAPATFSLMGDGWHLVGTASAGSLSTFATALSSLTNVKTTPGAVVFNGTDSSVCAFVDDAGGFEVIASGSQQSGTGTIASAITPGSTTTETITFGTAFSATPSNVLVTTDSSKINATATARSSTGITLSFQNVSSSNTPANVKYWWTAYA